MLSVTVLPSKTVVLLLVKVDALGIVLSVPDPLAVTELTKLPEIVTSIPKVELMENVLPPSESCWMLTVLVIRVREPLPASGTVQVSVYLVPSTVRLMSLDAEELILHDAPRDTSLTTKVTFDVLLVTL